MRDNRTILDEAARSIRRTFIGSVAGTVTMFAVIGAAGAYGLQDKLTAQGLSGAFATLHAKLTPIIEPAIERARPYFERSKPAQQPEEPASSDAPRSEPAARPLRPMPMVMPEPGESVVVPLPPPSAAKPAPVEPVAAATPPAAPVAAPAVAAPVVVEKAFEPPKAELKKVESKPAEAKPVEAKPVEAKSVEPKQVEAKKPVEPVAPMVAIQTPAEPVQTEETATTVVAVEAPAEPVTPAAEPKSTMTLASLPSQTLPSQALPWDLMAAPKATLALTDSAVATPSAPSARVTASEPATASPARPAAGMAPMAGRLPPYRTSSLAEPPAPTGSSALAKATAEPEAIVNTVTEPRPVLVHLPRPKPPLSPAQRLELTGKDYDKAEKCLAQAIYFEARNEPVRGQQAVAQVVLNRVFSPHYPKDVCSVVFQNAHRHLSCQFTFACDGKPEAIRERGAWARAMRISKQTLDAQIWLPDVNKATHYHAAYVRPNWIRDMKVMVRHGLHTFYRPRNWGDGSNEAKWGNPSNSVISAPTAVKPLTPAQKRFSYHRA